MLGPSPYALAVPAFPFRALAVRAGTAPLGGPREAALATLIAARLAAGAAATTCLPAALRASRADAAGHWISSIALPAAVRSAVLKLVDASTAAEARAILSALARVTDVTAPLLDTEARSELDRLGARFRS